MGAGLHIGQGVQEWIDFHGLCLDAAKKRRDCTSTPQWVKNAKPRFGAYIISRQVVESAAKKYTGRRFPLQQPSHPKKDLRAALAPITNPFLHY
jgi:hypothetical protein